MLEDGFSIIELAIVVAVIGVIVTTSVIAWHAAARRIDVQATAEMLKEDIRKVYALADSGVARLGNDGLKYRDRYILEINTDSEDPPNCYRILRQEYSGSAYGTAVVVDFEKSAANRTLEGGWIRPSRSDDTVIESVSGAAGTGPYRVTFESKGSIVQTTAGGDVDITIRTPSSDKSIDTTISIYGSVS